MRGGERYVTVTPPGAVPDVRGRRRAANGPGALPCVPGHAAASDWARGHMVFAKACGACGGSGQQSRGVVPTCGGAGSRGASREPALAVPAGRADGMQLRVPGGGHVGRRGGRPGDLFVVVRVENHRFFRREGDDLHIEVPVAHPRGGARGEDRHPDAGRPVKLRVPPGTASGQRLRLRERGAPSAAARRTRRPRSSRSGWCCRR